MIAKRIQRDKATSNYARLSKYVVAAKGGIEPSTWTRTADYILDTAHDGAKVGGVRVTNCLSDDPASAAQQILVTQQKNGRSKGDKSYHLVFSFPEGERPALPVLHAIEDHLVNTIGLGHHERISAVHTDTANLHVHVAINKIDPVSFNNIEPHYDKQRLMEACAALEKRYGLARTNHGLTTTQNHQEQTSHDRYATHDSNALPVRQPELATLARIRATEAFDGMRDVPGLDVVPDLQGSKLLLPDDPQYHVAGQDDLSRPGLRRSGHRAGGADGAEVAGGYVPGKAGDMEAHAGTESLIGWLRRIALPELASAPTWEALHAAGDRHGLAIRTRGDGLVIESDTGVRVKASQVSRGLSKDALEHRLGVFRPNPARRGSGASAYSDRPRHRDANTATLFAQYQRDRSATQAARRELASNGARAAAAHVDQLRSWYQQQRAALKTDPMQRGVLRNAASAALAERKRTEIAAYRLKASAERAAALNALPLPTWQHWLVLEAQRGNTVALDVLRSRGDRERRAKRDEDWLSGNDPAAARAVLLKSGNPRTDKTGGVHYTAADGTTLLDDKAGIRVSHRSEAAALLALTLAQQRFAGQALVVTGSDAFRAQLVATANKHRLSVVFADPTMEATRKAMRGQIEAPAAPARPQPKPATVVAAYVEERNAARANGATIVHHSEWEPSASGEAIYQGRRQLKDGTEAVLLQRGETMHVLPVTPAQAAKASRLPVGSAVTIDARGRFLDTQRRRGR